MSDKFYITTAISYPNGVPHIGHAYEVIATDAIARFMRLDGRDVYFLTGTDEHGLKMVQTAQKEGLEVKALANRNSSRFKAMAEVLNISNDDFIRTTEPRHARAAQALWQKMVDSGDIYLDGYEGWYSVRDEAYYDEDETSVRDDGVRIGPQGTPVEWTKEQTYFFRLSKYQDKLQKLYEEHTDFVSPDFRRNEVMSFVKRGLKDLSISRTTFDWGVPVPGAPGHVMYVWVDALTNYITALGYPDEKASNWAYWPANVHIIGKDIIRFHAVYWPAFLMSAGLPLPQRVFGHGFLLTKGEKMSKSLGNVVDPFEMVKAYGVDAMRFFMLREVSFGQDGNYSHEAIVNRMNADLANDLGNLAQRSLSMINKNCDAKLPQPGELIDVDIEILDAASSLLAVTRQHMKDFALNKVLDAIWTVVGDANRYFAAQEPWALKKTDPERMNTVLFVTADIIRRVAIMAQPVMPESCNKLLDLLNVQQSRRTFADLGAVLSAGTPLPAPKGVFPRYVEPEVPADAG